FRNYRRKRSEAFALFHQAVDPLAHCWVPWVGQDAPAAECARSEFHSALKPSHDLPAGEPLRDLTAQSFKRFFLDDFQIVALFNGSLRQSAASFFGREFRPP